MFVSVFECNGAMDRKLGLDKSLTNSEKNLTQFVKEVPNFGKNLTNPCNSLFHYPSDG